MKFKRGAWHLHQALLPVFEKYGSWTNLDQQLWQDHKASSLSNQAGKQTLHNPYRLDSSAQDLIYWDSESHYRMLVLTVTWTL